MWLGLLFGILSIAIGLREFNAEQPRLGTQLDYASLSASYREKTAQCLILGQYMRGGPYVIETLVHHFTAEVVRRRDVNNETWFILSTAVHLASMSETTPYTAIGTRSFRFEVSWLTCYLTVRMGYHKDPDHFKSISPYGMILTISTITRFSADEDRGGDKASSMGDAVSYRVRI